MVVGAAPYVVMAALTGFRTANSTFAQRTWIILWVVSGQGCLLVVIVVMEISQALGFSDSDGLFSGRWSKAVGLVAFAIAIFVVTCAIGGFVVVAQMILQDKVCIRV